MNVFLTSYFHFTTKIVVIKILLNRKLNALITFKIHIYFIVNTLLSNKSWLIGL